jgi:predicted PurR-regulated permease PerM
MPGKEAVMADQPVSNVPASSTAPGGQRRVAWRRVADGALIGVAVGAVLWLTMTAGASLTWFVIGLVIYELLLPLVNHLARVMPRALAAAIGVLLVLGLVVGGVSFLVPPLTAELGQLYASLPTGAQLQQMYATAYGWYETVVPAAIRSVVDSAASQLHAQASANLQGLLADASTRLAQIAERLVSLVVFLLGFIIVLVWLYQLWSARLGGQRLLRDALPLPLRLDVLNLFRLFHRTFVSYLRSQVVLSLITSAMIYAALGALNLLGYQIRSALLLAVVAGLARLIPFIGGIIATVPAVLLALLSPAHTLQHALVVFAVYQVAYMIEGYIINPQVTGAAVSIPPAVLTPLVIMFGAVFGVVGAVLAAPAAALARDWFLYVHRRLNGAPPRTAYRSLAHTHSRRSASAAARQRPHSKWWMPGSTTGDRSKTITERSEPNRGNELPQ